MMNNNIARLQWPGLGLLLLPLLVAGCSFGAGSNSNELTTQERYTRQAPGEAEYVWEPPMVDVVEVPPGLDPEGVYYRPAHKEVVEIRQGRWKHYKETEREEEEYR